MAGKRSERATKGEAPSPIAYDASSGRFSGLGLGRGELVLVDSSPLVYLLEDPEGLGAAAEAFFRTAAFEGIELAVSAFAFTELLEKPLARGDEALAARYRGLLAGSACLYGSAEPVGTDAPVGPRLVVEVLDAAIGEEAARLLARGRKPGPAGPALGLGDAIHIATARVLGARALLTNDGAWADMPSCPRVLLLSELDFLRRDALCDR